jgi:hypothetical protein
LCLPAAMDASNSLDSPARSPCTTHSSDKQQQFANCDVLGM